MPIITDPQKLSMPEQVQQNKDDIKEINKKIDGLDSLDNVVEVPNMSHILTAQELEAIEQPVAFIIYSNKVYLKRKIESGIAYFDRVFSISGSTVITFDSEEIQATLSNGALAMISNSVSTYSKSEIDTKFSTITYVDNQLALKANLTGANFAGAITAPSIIESMSGYSFTKSTENDPAEVSVEYLYVSVVKNGNKITFVCFVKINRLASISTGGALIGLGTFSVPKSVGNNLIPEALNRLSSTKVYVSSSYNTGTEIPLNVYKNEGVGADYITFRYYSGNDLTANTDYYARAEVTYLLSENMVE